MKKKILGGIAVLAIVAAASWNVNISSKNKGVFNHNDCSVFDYECIHRRYAFLFCRIGNSTVFISRNNHFIDFGERQYYSHVRPDNPAA